jgi:hypothetical protein
MMKFMGTGTSSFWDPVQTAVSGCGLVENGEVPAANSSLHLPALRFDVIHCYGSMATGPLVIVPQRFYRLYNFLVESLRASQGHV